MTTKAQVGARIDRLPTSKWHLETFLLVGLGLQINGFLNSAGGPVTAELIGNGWSNNYLNAAFSSAMMIGFFIGSLFGGTLGDKVGRKKSYQISIAIFGVMSIIATFSPNMYILILCRALMGIGMGSGIVIGYASFTEFVPGKTRGVWSSRLSLIGNLSPVIATLGAYLIIPNLGWRIMFLVGGIASLIQLMFISKYLVESPRWCIENGKVEEAETLLTNIEKRIEKEKNILLPTVEIEEYEEIVERKSKESLLSFFKGNLGTRTLIATTVLVAMNVSIYTITTWIPTIFVNNGIDITKSLLMTTLIMIGAPLGVYVSTLVIDLFPRKWLGVSLLLIIAALGYIYSMQSKEINIVIIGVTLTFFLYIYNSFASAVYAPEVWPTHIRLRGSGISNSIGRIVAIVTPYVIAWLLTEFNVTAVFIALGIVLGLCALILSIFGIETRKKSLEEIENQANIYILNKARFKESC